MSTLPFTIHRLDRSRIVLTVMFALLLVASMGVAGSSLAQDAASTDGHPLVGSWVIDAGDSPALASFTSDGIAIDVESTGEVGIGTWSATSETAGNLTFVIFFADDESGISGSIIIRAALEYDEATDTASGTYSVTGVGYDGTVYFTEDGAVTASRVPAEGPEMGGNPIPALVVGTPVATPAA
ncbi:MAG: hypothetical protein R2848_19995 [Thermomicrobiales bacterium]